MKKLKLTKILASLLVVSSVLAFNPIGASATWRQDSKGWWNTEGNSYSTGWKEIDGNWYYFYSNDNTYADSYNMKGYMAHDTIVGGFYLNSDGVYIPTTKGEKRVYENLLRTEEWLSEHTDFEKSGQVRDIILDINQDGISEMLLSWGEYSGGLGGLTLSVVTYNNGKVNIENINTSHGRYYGYSSSEKVFFICGANGGNSYIKGYKLDNNQCKEVYSCEDNSGRVGAEKATYILSGQKVSKAEYDESFKKFGKIDRNQIL